jgi:hypothetical protein
LLKEHGVGSVEEYHEKFISSPKPTPDAKTASEAKDCKETQPSSSSPSSSSTTVADAAADAEPAPKKRRLLVPSVLAEFPQPLYTSPNDCDVYHRNKRQHVMQRSMFQLTLQQRRLANVNRCRYLAVQHAQLGRQWVIHQSNRLADNEYKEAMRLRATTTKSGKKGRQGSYSLSTPSLSSRGSPALSALASPYGRDANRARRYNSCVCVCVCVCLCCGFVGVCE